MAELEVSCFLYSVKMKFAVAFALLIGTLAVEATEVPRKRVEPGYKYYPSVDGWMKLHFLPERFTDARLRCLREGSTLASPLNPAMLEAMKGLLGNKVSMVLTGISADYAPGFYYSVEGVALDDIPVAFDLAEADTFRSFYGCSGMYPNGNLKALRCNTHLPFICYVKDSEVPQIQSPCGIDSEYVYENRTSKCYKFHTYGQTWSDAFMTCAIEGGHLAIINSDVEAQALVDLVKRVPDGEIHADYPTITLLGFRDWGEHKNWMTIHGETLEKAGYSRWGPHEPNDPDLEYCGSMQRNGELNDTRCRSNIPFICEKTPAYLPGEENNEIGVTTV